MSYAAKTLRTTLRRLITTQLSLVLAAVAIYFSLKGWQAAIACLYGGAIALFNTLVSAQRLRRASESAGSDAARGMMELYIGAVIRFVATPALVVVGIVLLKLEPIAIIVGFAVAQLGYFFGSARSTKTMTPNS